MSIAADAPIDLQLHTVFSDGAWEADALIDHLLQEGFAAAAITDHDRVDIIPMLQKIAAEKGFTLLPAVEMSTHWRTEDEAVDVLCFGITQTTSPLHTLADDLLQRTQKNIRQTVAAIAQQGYTLPADAVQAILDEPCVRQPHSLVKLVDNQGIVPEGQSIGRLLVEGGLKVLTNPIVDVVTAAHQSGAVCIIGHPGRGDGFVNFDAALLDELREEVVIDGIEAHYPLHTPEQVEMFNAYAHKHDLFVSAGSDSHTPEKPPIKYRADTSRKLLEHLGHPVA